MKRIAGALAVVALAVVALAACGGVDEGERVQPFEQPGDTSAAVDTTAAPAKTNVVGDKVALRNGDTLQVHSYTQNVTAANQFSKPATGMVFAVADVEGCAKEANPTGVVNPFFFELQMPDNTRADATFQPVKGPELRSGAQAPGDCIRGNVAFEVPAGTKPVAVVFSGFGTSVKWNIT